MGLRYAVVALGCLACRTAGHGILVSPPPRVGTLGPNNQGNKLIGDAGSTNCGGTDNGDTAYEAIKNQPKVAQKPGDGLVVSWSITIPHEADNLNRGVRIALHYSDGDSFNNNVRARAAVELARRAHPSPPGFRAPLADPKRIRGGRRQRRVHTGADSSGEVVQQLRAPVALGCRGGRGALRAVCRHGDHRGRYACTPPAPPLSPLAAPPIFPP